MSACLTNAPIVAVAVAIAFFAGVRPAGATLIIVPNATFQNPDLADNAFTDTGSTANAVPNWTFIASPGGIVSAGVWDPGITDYPTAAGNNVKLPGTADGGQAAYIYLEQDSDLAPLPLSGDLTTAAPVALVESDTSYDLTVALGRAVGVPAGDVTISLLISKFPIASVVIPAASIPENNFADFILNFETYEDYPFAGAELHARITHAYSGPGAVSVDIDNVRFESNPVPEPAAASLALLAIGAAVTSVRRRPRRTR